MEYQNGKIYKIVCEKTKRVYIGSTCVSLVRRLNGHRKKCNECITRDFINPTIFLIEEYPCDTKEKLLTRELYWMQNTECVNTVRPILSKEEILKQNKKYDDYSNGKIYKIECSKTGLVYIGSTIQTLNKRLSGHKKSSRSAIRDFINPTILLIEEYPCDRKDQLLTRERFYMETIECINKYRPIRTKEDKAQEQKQYEINHKESLLKYRFDNKEKINGRSKQYYENNKEKILEKMKEKITCECGCIITRSNIGQHRKSKKHIKLTT